ncbi:MAG: hypothetical protein JXA30_17970 [Deltaproteobacteria bacterium]|nr:hypothetical protein [Deltaproteobacteria bacterium]
MTDSVLPKSEQRDVDYLTSTDLLTLVYAYLKKNGERSPSIRMRKHKETAEIGIHRFPSGSKNLLIYLEYGD